MSLKSSLLALAENIGMCQENARSIKQALAAGLADAGAADVTVNPWTLVKTETGQVDITLPESFDELLCVITPPSPATKLSIVIPKADLGESAAGYASGRYAGASTYESGTVNVSLAKATLSYVQVSGTDVAANTKLSVYYR